MLPPMVRQIVRQHWHSSKFSKNRCVVARTRRLGGGGTNGYACALDGCTGDIATPGVRPAAYERPALISRRSGLTFFHSAATCLHVRARLTRESTKREGLKPRTSERHV